MTHALAAASKRAWNVLTRVRPSPTFNEPRIETISVRSRFDQACRCDVIWLRIRGHWHCAFLNRPGEVQSPTGHIEALAAAALKMTRARRNTVTIWDIDRRSSGETTAHQVEFTRGGWPRLAGPTWTDDSPPPELRAGIEEALRRQWERTGVADAMS